MEEKEIQPQEEGKACKCGCKCGCFLGKMFCLKGLSVIYKVLTALVGLYMAYFLVMIWYIVFKDDVSKAEALRGSVEVILGYGFYALALWTVAVVLKALAKIKCAVTK